MKVFSEITYSLVGSNLYIVKQLIYRQGKMDESNLRLKFIDSLVGNRKAESAPFQFQYKWLKKHDGIDYVDFMRKVASFRGLQCRIPYAEGFRPYSVWGRIKAKRLLP